MTAKTRIVVAVLSVFVLTASTLLVIAQQQTMTLGDNAHIDYIVGDGIYRRASLTNTDLEQSFPWQHTTDPSWNVDDPVKNIPYGQHKSILYMGGDRRIWHASVKCTYYGTHPGHAPDRIVCKFNHEPHEHDGKSHELSEIGFWGWDNKRWIASIQEVHKPFPKAPRFLVRQVE